MTVPPPPDLTHERAQVLAIIAGSPMAGAPHVDAAAPLRPLPPALEAKLADRADAAGGKRARLGIRDRLTVARARRWRSTQNWTGPLASGDERGLVIAAARAAHRIAGSPAWRTGRLDEQRVRLDLAAELDQIDQQAHRIAVARQGTGAVAAGSAPAIDAAWSAALDRVAALTAYANQLDGYAQRRREELARSGDPVRDADLLAGSVQDEIALTQLVALTTFLAAQPDLLR
jgi:hypothetical protein